jgi:tetratricopeptide (TPR) repeat protein/serine/threonine protein kinase
MAEELPPTLRPQALYADQRGRWERGERVPVESYLRQYPCLESDTECVLQLINNEVVLREEREEPAWLEEYLERFPRLRAQLEELFEIHRALESDGSASPDSEGPRMVLGGGEPASGCPPKADALRSGEETLGSEEQLLPWLLARENAPAADAGYQAPSTAEPPSQLRQRLQDDLACIQLLRQVLPRHATPEDTAAPPSLPLRRLGRFEIHRELGQGAFGMVFLATDPQLGRVVALKVPRPEALLTAELRERFVREARAAAGLDHPNVVPVYEAGTEGPICYIASAYCPGITLADWLARRSEAVPLRVAAWLLATLARGVQHAHERGVVHRDLKPGNVLLQGRPRDPADANSTVNEPGGGPGAADAEPDFLPRITDFGLAKLMVEAAGPVGEGGGVRTQSGAVLGTPAYMAPEQASGKNRAVGPAADVYALGTILYELLTGRPPFLGETVLDTLEQVCNREPLPPHRLRPKLSRDLETICLKCLQKDPRKRYGSAAALADDLDRYLAGEPIQDRPIRVWERGLKWARRKPAVAGLWVAGLAVLLLLLGGVAVWWQGQRRRSEAEGAAALAMAEARLLRDQARADPLSAAGYDKAMLAAAKAGEVARAGGASEAVQRQAEQLLDELQAEAEAAVKDRRLLARLLEARGPREGPKYSRDDKGMMMVALAEPTAEEQFASAFHDWGLDVDATPTAEATERLKGRPAAVVTEVIAALDEWASQRRVDRKPEAARRLAELAAALDHDPLAAALDDPRSLRRELRELLAQGRLPLERALGVLSAALRPVPVPVAVPLGKDRARLRQLAERIDPTVEPVLGLVTLTRALRAAGEEALAEQLLRAALTARPREVVLYHTLGQLLTGQEPPRWAEAVECYRAARVLRPDLGVNLATALQQSGRWGEALGLLAWLVKERPDNPYLHFHQAYALDAKHDLDGAIACYKKAIELDSKDAPAHNNLGNALKDKHDLDGALACCKKALALDPTLAPAHNNLGTALKDKGDLDGAIACCKKAIALDPTLAPAHNNLGNALRAKHDLGGALACYKKALALDPKYADAHNNLGNALKDKHDLDGAIACYKKAIELDSKYAPAHNGLGNALKDKHDLDGALACYHKALALDPKYAPAHNNLGNALYDKGDLGGALACYKKAIELDSKYAPAHNNLGNALKDKHDLDGTLACYKKAIELDPKYAPAHNNLGTALYAKHDLDGALACYKKALALDPTLAPAHNNLGNALYAKHDLDGALACYKKAIELDPTLAPAHNGLGVVLRVKHDLDGAIACYKKALALDPKDAPAHYNLGRALYDKHDLDGAIACYKKAIELNPMYAHAHGAMGRALLQQGRYAAAGASTRRALESLPPDTPLHRTVLRQLQQCDHLLALDKKLPPILQGEATPADPGEALTLAQMCQQHKKRHAAAARLYADAFAAEPKLAADLQQQHRYNAACSAALAAAGQGEDARRLPDKVVAMFRRRALDWLRADLAAYAQLAGQNKPAVNQAIQQRLRHWWRDADLASVRDPEALDRLADNDRAAWRALWRDVDGLAEQLAKKDEPAKGRQEPETPKAEPGAAPYRRPGNGALNNSEGVDAVKSVLV